MEDECGLAKYRHGSGRLLVPEATRDEVMVWGRKKRASKIKTMLREKERNVDGEERVIERKL